MYNSDYIPKAPAESIRIRLYAEEKYAQLKQSPATEDKSKFMDWLNNLNKEILGITPKYTDTAEKQASHYSSGGFTDTHNKPVQITNDMRQPSFPSLYKLQSLRDSIAYSVGVSLPPEDMQTSHQRKKESYQREGHQTIDESREIRVKERERRTDLHPHSKTSISPLPSSPSAPPPVPPAYSQWSVRAGS
eukprot:CAMPEP_0182422298 /NCGR_PEP_ID=MMETSP1167-20130531/7940_1 /TAXON_ID=2988 /ORGANISM="Mallomonas Sp, Strain CCMP3275" /LENGTH=189 /DNA_ID=CAMNT_0024600233 /DNA_START=151 /DNA_END=716 /DNA_ORIENTATION=-